MGRKRRFVIVLACAALLCGCSMLTAMLDSYAVTYDANGATAGSVPTDAAAYKLGDSVTVAGNTGSLANAGKTFSGWNTKADGSGTTYAPGAAFFMGPSDVTLYAAWSATASGDATLKRIVLTFGGTDYALAGSDFTDYTYDFLEMTGSGLCTITVTPTDPAAVVRSVTLWSNTHGSFLTPANDGSYSLDFTEVADAELTITIEAPDGAIASYLLYVYSYMPMP
jgi:hypothetical protein